MWRRAGFCQRGNKKDPQGFGYPAGRVCHLRLLFSQQQPRYDVRVASKSALTTPSGLPSADKTGSAEILCCSNRVTASRMLR